MAASGRTPNRPAVSIVRNGRSRLPPPSAAWRMAASRRAGRRVSPGRACGDSKGLQGRLDLRRDEGQFLARTIGSLISPDSARHKNRARDAFGKGMGDFTGDRIALAHLPHACPSSKRFVGEPS